MGGVFERPGFWIVLIVLILLLFGAKRLPDLSRSVGRSLRIFKSETDGLRNDAEKGNGTADTNVGGEPPAPAPRAVTSAPAGPRYLVDPETGERVLANPVQNPPQQP